MVIFCQYSLPLGCIAFYSAAREAICYAPSVAPAFETIDPELLIRPGSSFTPTQPMILAQIVSMGVARVFWPEGLSCKCGRCHSRSCV